MDHSSCQRHLKQLLAHHTKTTSLTTLQHKHGTDVCSQMLFFCPWKCVCGEEWNKIWIFFNFPEKTTRFSQTNSRKQQTVCWCIWDWNQGIFLFLTVFLTSYLMFFICLWDLSCSDQPAIFGPGVNSLSQSVLGKTNVVVCIKGSDSK